MKWLYPRISLRTLPVLVAACAAGSLVAGCYGILHDQVTFTLAPEYFTKFKFLQFGYADSALPERVIVARIGFAATWWVGMIGGWVLVRLAPIRDGESRGNLFGRVLSHFWPILVVALVFGLAGYFYGSWRTAEEVPAGWNRWRAEFGVVDLAAFARAGYVHNFGYLGALCGLVLAAVLLRRKARST